MEDNGDILDGPPGGRDELRAIVARAGQHRRRALGTTAAGVGLVALVAGAGIGYAVSDRSPSQTVVAGSAPTTLASPAPGLAPSVVSGGAAVGFLPVYGSLSKKFTRTVGDISVRAFGTGRSPSVYGSACGGSYTGLQAELSTPGMVGESFDFAPATAPSPTKIISSRPDFLGTAEGAPVDVVIVYTGAAVKEVKAVFPGGATDQMAPVGGWSVLVAPGQTAKDPAAPTINLTAYGSGGSVLGRQPAGSGDMQPMYGCSGCPPIFSPAASGTGTTIHSCVCPATEPPVTGGGVATNPATGYCGSSSGGGTGSCTVEGSSSQGQTTGVCSGTATVSPAERSGSAGPATTVLPPPTAGPPAK